jgi:hypothetical protein
MKNRIAQTVRTFTVRWCKPAAAAVAALALVLASAALAGGGNQGNPGILPPQSNPHGQSYGEWGAAWWNWALNLPPDAKVLWAQGPYDASVGQSGSVWFLAGTIGDPTPYVRYCTIPPGKALFFPIWNYICGSAVWDCKPTNPDVDCNLDGLLALAAERVGEVTSLQANIDGVPVQNPWAYVAELPSALTVVEGGLLNSWGVDAGTYSPNVTAGFCLMLAPLSVGSHTIHFAAAVKGEPALDITYHITVKPNGK